MRTLSPPAVTGVRQRVVPLAICAVAAFAILGSPSCSHPPNSASKPAMDQLGLAHISIILPDGGDAYVIEDRKPGGVRRYYEDDGHIKVVRRFWLNGTRKSVQTVTRGAEGGQIAVELITFDIDGQPRQRERWAAPPGAASAIATIEVPDSKAPEGWRVVGKEQRELQTE